MTITIGGKFGSGGKAIAEKLAEMTGCKLCGDEFFREALLQSGEHISESIIEAFDESLGDSSINEMRHQSTLEKKGFSGLSGNLMSKVEPVDERLGNIYRETIEKFADEGDCIILGHFGDYFLRDRKDCLRVFVIDAPESRKERIAESRGITPEKAEKIIAEADKRRAQYYKFYTDDKWGEFGTYDLLCDCSAFGIEGCAKLIKAASEIK